MALAFILLTLVTAFHAVLSKNKASLLFYLAIDTLLIAGFSNMFGGYDHNLFVAGLVAVAIDLFCLIYVALAE